MTTQRESLSSRVSNQRRGDHSTPRDVVISECERDVGVNAAMTLRIFVGHLDLAQSHAMSGEDELAYACSVTPLLNELSWNMKLAGVSPFGISKYK